MNLYTAHRAPHPRRVLMFLAEKGVQNVHPVNVDLLHGEQHQTAFRTINPTGTIPVLELDDGRFLSESRAICSYLEGLYPEPNLMGQGWREHAFIEMQDRRVETYFFLPLLAWIRHTVSGVQALVPHPIAEFAEQQKHLAMQTAQWLDAHLTRQPWVAGERFTVADITTFCAVEVARIKHFHPRDAQLHHLQAWRDKVAARPSASAV